MTGSDRLSESLLERVRRQPPHWAQDPIAAWEPQELQRLRPFVQASYWTDQGSVNVFRVVGSEDLENRDKCWLDFLETGRRMPRNLALYRQNPTYYRGTERKEPTMDYLTLDGLSFYVGNEGAHRTCIARFDFHYNGLTMLHGVTVNHHQVDWTLWERYRQLVAVCVERTLPVMLTPYRVGFGREDTAGWKLDRYRTRIKYDDPRKGTPEILDRDGLKAKIDELTGPAHRRFFNWFH